ncbi:MAG: FAD-binding protein [Coprococcus sp.]
MIERYDLIVIGAGPAGLSAAIEAAKNGMKPIVFDEMQSRAVSSSSRYTSSSVQRNTRRR